MLQAVSCNAGDSVPLSQQGSPFVLSWAGSKAQVLAMTMDFTSGPVLSELKTPALEAGKSCFFLFVFKEV